MKRPVSPTLLSLVLLGFILVAMPLLAALVLSIAQVKQLAGDSAADMLVLQQHTAASRDLVDRATSMERSARQYLVLKDPALLEVFAGHRQAMLELMGQLSADPASAERAAALEVLRTSQSTVSTLLVDHNGSAGETEFEDALTALRADAQEVLRTQDALARDMASAFPQRAEDLQRTLGWVAVLVVPLSAALAGVFLWIIGPPLRRIRGSIRALGQGALGVPVIVKGPRDLEELGQRLEWLRLRLVELEEQKARFLRNVSHELKTPLASIREGAELLAGDGVGASAQETAQIAGIVRDNSLRLQKMIEALLRYGSENDLVVAQPFKPVVLDQLVREVIERETANAAARSVTIESELAPTRVLGSARRLQVIVENLLSNALRYSPPGGKIRVQLQSTPARITLEVRDEGPGIPEQDRERVFEWFYTGPRPAASIVAGTGLGLAISREYAEQHDGTLTLVPSDRGAHFRLAIRNNIA